VAPFLLFALFAGHVADRYDRRRVMLATQVLLLSASVLLAFASRSVALIYACLFLIQMARALQGPARQAMVPQIVPAHALSNAIAWHTSAFEIASVTGPALAGILVAAAGSRAVYLIQVGCAGLTLASVWMMRYRGEGKRADAPREGQPLLEGLRFVRRSRLVLPAISLDLFAVLFGGATALLPIFAVDILHAGARGLGWLRAASSIGAILMAFLQAHPGPFRRSGLVLLWSVAGFGASTGVFGFSRSLWLSFAMLMAVGALDNVSVVLRQSLVQKKTPDAVRGRVLAVNSIFISCSNQLGAVESGWTAAWFGAVPSVVGGGLATVLIVAAFAAGSRELREWTE
jgi:MFS family permease